MSDSPHYLLSLDLGTSGCKLALVSTTGALLGWAYRPVAVQIVGQNGAEQRPDDWWRAFVEATHQLLRQTGVAPQRILAICSSTQGEGTVAVDRQGVPLADALIWMDMRGAAALARQVGGRLKVSGYDLFKLQRWIRLCGGAPALSGKDPAGHMLYLRDHQPRLYERTYKFLNVLDYLNFKLSGRFVATQDSILTSWVTDNRDVNAIRYDDRLIRASGIARDKFPDLVRCTDTLGTLTRQASEELGLPRTTQVVAGSIDNTAAAIGAGAIADYDAHLYIGSSSWIGAHVPFKKTHVLDQITAVPCALPSKYMMVALQTSGANNVAFLKDRIIFHEDDLLQGEPPPEVYDTLDEIVARMPAGAEGVMYLPWLFGERCPVDDPSLRGCLFNLGMQHSRETVARAVFEGAALNTRWMLKPVNRFLGRRLDHLTIIGGGARSNAWCQIFADTLNLQIRQLADPIKANAMGAAIIGAVGLGLTDFQSAVAWVEPGRRYEPNPALRALYDERFGVFTELHRRLAPLYRRLNGAAHPGATHG